MNTLFDTQTLEQPKERSPHTCRHCKHRQTWTYWGDVGQYCGIKRSWRTQNGLLKIKAKDLQRRQDTYFVNRGKVTKLETEE